MKDKHQYTNEEISRAAMNVRKRVLRIVLDGGGGYLGQTCSSAEIFMTLYLRLLNIGDSLGSPDAIIFPGAPGRNNKGPAKGGLYYGPCNSEYDRFFISTPQYATAVYSALVECGRLGADALKFINVDGYNMELIAADHSPGFDNMAGSLSQTISLAAGTAHARKMKGETGRVFVFITDGESQEGQTWEAIQTAVYKKLDNLIAFMDVNGQQCEGATKDILNLDAQMFLNRFKAFGAEAVLIDGHDIDALTNAVSTPHSDKPLVIVCKTDCTTGIPMLEKKRPNLHFIAFGKDELAEIEAFYAKM